MADTTVTGRIGDQEVQLINAASEARRAAVDNAASTGAEIIAATVGAFG